MPHCLGSAVETTAGLRQKRSDIHRARLAAAVGICRSNEQATAKALRAACKCGRDHVVWSTPQGLEVSTYLCKRRVCAECMSDWSSSLAARAISVASVVKPGRLRHLVLTIPNQPRGGLKAGVEQLTRSWREYRNEGKRAKSGGYWTPDGYMWKFEVHFSRKGWHPHLHVLLDGSLAARHGDRAREHWHNVTGRYGPPASHRDGLWIVAPPDAEGAAREVAKYAAKPVSLDDMSAATLQELAAATRGRRWHGSAGSMALGRAEVTANTDEPSGWHMLGSASAIVGKAMDEGKTSELALDVLDLVAQRIAGTRERRKHVLYPLLASYLADLEAAPPPHGVSDDAPQELADGR